MGGGTAEEAAEPPAPAPPPPDHDNTTLLQNDEESFALAPVDATVLKGNILIRLHEVYYLFMIETKDAPSKYWINKNRYVVFFCRKVVCNLL